MPYVIHTPRGYVRGIVQAEQALSFNDAPVDVMTFASSKNAEVWITKYNNWLPPGSVVLQVVDQAEARAMAVAAIGRDAVQILKQIEELATGPYWETKRRWKIGELAAGLQAKLRTGLIGGEK